jgi:hypothetical protein
MWADLEDAIATGCGVVDRHGQRGHGPARHPRLQRLVALTLLRGGSNAGPEIPQHFRMKAEALARLQHPHKTQARGAGPCPMRRWRTWSRAFARATSDHRIGLAQTPAAPKVRPATLSPAGSRHFLFFCPVGLATAMNLVSATASQPGQPSAASLSTSNHGAFVDSFRQSHPYGLVNLSRPAMG